MKHLSSLHSAIRVALALSLAFIMVTAADISEAAGIAERVAGGLSLKRLVALGAVVVVLALGTWLALRRNKRGFITLAGVVLLATAALGAR